MDCISPIDGRYKRYTFHLKNYFSEYGLFKYRLKVEIYYIISLLEFLKKNKINKSKVESIYLGFNENECDKIKQIENTINHDVKAVEYYIGKKFEELKLNYRSFIHFGLTSQDINNTAISLSIKDYFAKYFFTTINQILQKIDDKVDKWKDIKMISRTHGQSAVPTYLGKEMNVFHYRLQGQLKLLGETPIFSKFGGAVGNLNAHKCAYPDLDWDNFAEVFLNGMGLQRSKFTTQIDNYDNLGCILDNIKRMNTILIDLCRDIWHYISIGYFSQKFNKNEVGSSTMPHKINPINFENAEGNLMLSVNLCEFLSRKLPISRLQRDLTDSTVLRNIGMVFGYCEVAFSNIMKGLEKIVPNKKLIEKDLVENVIVISEGIQTILRKHGVQYAYEEVKTFTRNNFNLTQEDINVFINNLNLSDEIKNELNKITIQNY